MKVYMLRGVGCSGKSSICNKFDPSDVIESDEFRRRYLGSVMEQRFNKMIFDKMADCLEARLTNMCSYTVIDSTNLKMKDGRRFRDLVEHYRAELVILDVEPPSIEELMERNMSRFYSTGVYIPMHVFEKHIKTYWDSLTHFENLARSKNWVQMLKIDQQGLIKETVGV